MSGGWGARVRTAALAVVDPIEYRKLTLVETYNAAPDMLMVEGTLDGLRPAITPGSGLIVYDDTGAQRFSGILTSIDRIGGKSPTANLIYASDLIYLRWRYCYPVTTAPWATAGQNASNDVLTASAEARLVSYVNRNAGPAAYHGLYERRVSRLRMPAVSGAGRGPTAKTSARFDNLAELVSSLAESAGLRVTVEQTFDGTTPWLDLKLTAAPDLSASVRFGTAFESGPFLLGDEWRYRLDIPGSTFVQSAAGGEGTARILNYLDKTTSDEAQVWGLRIESFIDQRGTTDATEIAEGLAGAWAEAAGLREVAAPIGSDEVGFGTTVPIGSKVAAVVDGERLVDRIRQITTTVAVTSGEPTVKTEAVFGSPDSGPATPTQRKLKQALARLSVIERTK